MGAKDMITEDDLLEEIAAFLPKPRKDGEYTLTELAKKYNKNPDKMLEAIQNMREAGYTISERKIVSRNGRTTVYYCIEKRPE